MSSFDSASLVKMTSGDLLNSSCQTLVNTVNCVGVMGKGIAMAFKRRYPAMYKDYVRRCDAGLVRLGEPYIYRADDHLIVNFPTKDHWRSVSRLDDIEVGLRYLKAHLGEWGVTSIAVPPLGCGNGQLEWSVVGPTLYRHLRDFGIPVELYAPHEIGAVESQLAIFEDADKPPTIDHEPKVGVPSLVLVEILARLEAERYHWPIGRIMLQKMAYFATAAGLPTGLTFEANNFGPYSPALKPLIARLQNNGLVAEQRRGPMFISVVGPTFEDARRLHADELRSHENLILRVADLMVRFNSHRAEVAGTVHYVAATLAERFGRAPSATEVIAGVERWKVRRDPPITRAETAKAIVELALREWINVTPDDSIRDAVSELMGV